MKNGYFLLLDNLSLHYLQLKNVTICSIFNNLTSNILISYGVI